MSDPQLSPRTARRWPAWNRLNAERDTQTDVWLVPAAGGEARALASSPVGDDTPRWSPDGEDTYMAFLSERPRPGVTGDNATEAKRRYWLIRPDRAHRSAHVRPGSVSAFEWSADGKTLGFLAREPRSQERAAREGQGRRLDALDCTRGAGCG